MAPRGQISVSKWRNRQVANLIHITFEFSTLQQFLANCHNLLFLLLTTEVAITCNLLDTSEELTDSLLQEYFICDWWFNFDCAEAEGLYSLNDDLAAEREAATGAASSPAGSYASPDSAPIGGYDAPADVVEDAQAAYGQAARNARNGRGPQNFGGAAQRRGRNGRRNGRRN